jgi:hypothetical protein
MAYTAKNGALSRRPDTMALNLADYELKAREAVQLFWRNREAARQKQIDSGSEDRGERAGVTAGKNMDGVLSLVEALAHANGLSRATIHRDRALLTLPGFFRPTKLWDMLIMNEKRLVAALEFSLVGEICGSFMRSNGGGKLRWRRRRENATPLARTNRDRQISP